ncbi:glycosyltransferase involved in cell wall biosynthesis [Desulfobotulus alkaliphilus]|uniref:Glycosyltransferase involved in cell wall biosynthesis n=1 Tax=Desulfobotulus alkaliphilus TaxID=622671 RepID=A0A562S855_9BACT|nr:glycosyltransferase [Desulfobotulus alkaliphilus]TWI76904.1 glycosyltransferase involved in cell wall biosynthesis [Desulfobotulus alkaliphilus]
MNFSVLMSVYAKERPEYLREALQSLADQTLKANEVVLVEDGPLGEGLKAVIEDFCEILNIKSVALTTNQGLAAALNEGLKHCNHELVARMDSDDISLPHRFEKQVPFMQENPHVIVMSGWIEEFDENMENVIFTRRVPQSHASIGQKFKSQNQINHVAVMFRKSNILGVGGYPAEIKKAQDYCLWAKLFVQNAIFHNLQEVLVRVRTGDAFFYRRGFEYLLNELQMLGYQRKIGFISDPTYILNILIRSVARLSPEFIKKLIYKYARK